MKSSAHFNYLLELLVLKSSIYKQPEEPGIRQGAVQILESGEGEIVLEQGASEGPKFCPKPTPSKADSSHCFGISAIPRK